MRRRLKYFAGTALLVLALLDVLFWTRANRQFFDLVSMQSPPRSPEQFAERMPELHGAMWLLRINLFNRAPTALEQPWGIANEFWVNVGRHMALALATGLAGMGLLLSGGNARPRTTRVIVRRICLAGALVLAASAAFSRVTRTRRVPLWDRRHDPNILNQYYDYGAPGGGISAVAVRVPRSDRGQILTRREPGDVHVLLDSRGRIQIGGTMMSLDILEVIVRGVVRDQLEVRWLLWMDTRSAPEARNGVLAAIRDNGRAFVVVDFMGEPMPGMDFRAVSLAEYRDEAGADSSAPADKGATLEEPAP